MNYSEENEISERATRYANENYKAIVKQETEKFDSEENPVSVFMAGSPGAGKTETSISLLENTKDFLGNTKGFLENTNNILRIDMDELRNHFIKCGYQGNNSHLFQKAATKLVHEIHNQALKKNLSFLLDSTFSSESIARQNIERSLKRKRDVFILFVYQQPLKAWDLVQKREQVEGRRVRMEDFAKKFCASREVVDKLKKEFQQKITLRLICKNIDGTDKFYRKNVDCIGDYIPEKYNKEQILAQIQP